MTVEIKQKKANSWILFLKEYSKEQNVSYSSLIGDPNVKALYMASKKPVTVIEVVPDVPDVPVVITEKVKKEKKPKKEKKEKNPKKVKVAEEVIVVE